MGHMVIGSRRWLAPLSRLRAFGFRRAAVSKMNDMRGVRETIALVAVGMLVCAIQGLAIEPDVEFLDGFSLQIPGGWGPRATGVFESSILSVRITTYSAAKFSLNTAASRLIRIGHVGSHWEIPTEWKVWDSTSNQDGHLDSDELVDSGWLEVSAFIQTFQDSPIRIPSGWTGEIYVQMRMTRSGLGNAGGEYSAALTVDVVGDP